MRKPAPHDVGIGRYAHQPDPTPPWPGDPPPGQPPQPPQPVPDPNPVIDPSPGNSPMREPLPTPEPERVVVIARGPLFLRPLHADQPGAGST
jgi:periplasmic protein TonB